jgi:F-type H+-transporting ATPase subunit a
MLAHLVPQSTPPILMPFMVIIETVRNLIRPLTLAVRLTANIIAGHLLITLLGNQIADNSIVLSGSILLITQITLLILESAVALIQSYVFTVLACLYSSEVNYVNPL